MANADSNPSSPTSPSSTQPLGGQAGAPAEAERINVLLIGSGGREHALAWKLSQSPMLGTLYSTGCSNPGIAELARPVPQDIPISARDAYQLYKFIAEQKIKLVVIGPEDPLAEGMTDALTDEKFGKALSWTPHIFGPSKAGAMLEADKAFAKEVMRGAAIPTAEARTFRDAESARRFIESRLGGEPILENLFRTADEYADSEQRRLFIDQQVHKRKDLAEAFSKVRYGLPVIKAAGLAKGKGVVVPSTLAEAMDAITRIMGKLEFGEAGRTVVIEERLQGREVSVFALSDGKSIFVLEPCQDHKRLGDGATGPNTGGMGSLCPTPALDAKTMARVEREIILPTVDALKRENIEFKGIIYYGLMLTPSGPKVLEYNVRFGDPECQALMVRWKSDLLAALLACAQRKLDKATIEWHPGASVSVILAAAGYPDKPRPHDVITGLEDAARVEGVQVFHAGTRRNNEGNIVTAGGRVLAVTAFGRDRDEARQRAYCAAEMIHFDGKQVRTDIGTDVVG
jgi:phosphoribosylamine---glycine ligase